MGFFKGKLTMMCSMKKLKPEKLSPEVPSITHHDYAFSKNFSSVFYDF